MKHSVNGMGIIEYQEAVLKALGIIQETAMEDRDGLAEIANMWYLGLTPEEATAEYTSWRKERGTQR